MLFFTVCYYCFSSSLLYWRCISLFFTSLYVKSSLEIIKASHSSVWTLCVIFTIFILWNIITKPCLPATQIGTKIFLFFTLHLFCFAKHLFIFNSFLLIKSFEKIHDESFILLFWFSNIENNQPYALLIRLLIVSAWQSSNLDFLCKLGDMKIFRVEELVLLLFVVCDESLLLLLTFSAMLFRFSPVSKLMMGKLFGS